MQMCVYILLSLKSKFLCDYDQALGNQVKFSTQDYVTYKIL